MEDTKSPTQRDTMQGFNENENEIDQQNKDTSFVPDMQVVEPFYMNDKLKEFISDLEENVANLKPIGEQAWEQAKNPLSYKNRLIDLVLDYPEPEFMLQFENKKFFTRGDVITIKGKPKKGKSHLMISFCIALLNGSFIGINRFLFSPPKILYIDAEMNPNYTALLARKIHRLAGLNPRENSENLFVLNLKMDTPAERERIIEEAIRELKPDIVFIDGVKDITRTEPNDQAEGKRIGEELKVWTAKYDCMIGVAIHENKNDLNSRGAVGASVEEISSEVWRIDKDMEGIFTASQTLSRYHTPVENLAFTMDDSGNIQEAEAKPKADPKVAKLEKLQFLFQEIFTNKKMYSFTDLQKEYMRVKQVEKTAAFNAISEAVKNQIIIKNLIGDYELNNLTLPHFHSQTNKSDTA